MAHHTQRKNVQCMDAIKTELAKLMPTGASDTKFRALLQRSRGIHPRTLDRYLNVMLEMGEIEFDYTTRTWRIPVG